jgi:methylmalonyl-CoA/ethylmalonyl-CoA epimerase
VRDLEATMGRYVDDYGIRPWEAYEFDAGRAEDFSSTVSPLSAPRALPSPRSARCMGADRPARRRHVYARFLAEKGEGVQHVAVVTPDFDETLAQAHPREWRDSRR